MRVTDLADLAVVTVLLWIGIAWLRTARARIALVGLVILGGVYLVAREIGLTLTAWILQGFVTASVIVVVVVFQDDIRRLFERIAVLGMVGRPLVEVADAFDTLVRAVTQLASQKRGALLVIPGSEPLDRHLEGGIRLDARISEPLLLSLFDPNSPGHDGAVILGRDQATHFAVHLPLSVDHAQLGQRGTRHAAALGLSERTDALCLVVSEERGTVSVARDGKLRTLNRPELAGREIRRFMAKMAPSQEGSRWQRMAARWREGAVAVAVGVPLWLLTVPGASVIEVRRSAPVIVQDLPPGFTLSEIEPPEVEVILSGPRRSLLFLEADAIDVRINTVLVKLGRRTFQVTPDDVSHPAGTQVVAIEPAAVKISLSELASPGS